MRRVVIPLISGALVASGLVGVAVTSAPPAAAAFSCPNTSPPVTVEQTGSFCEYNFLSAGTFSLPSGMTLGYDLIIIGGGGGGGGGQDPTGFNLYGYAGGVGGVVTGSGSSSSISITTVGAGGTGGRNATTLAGTDARAGGSGGDTTVVGYTTATGGTPGLVGGAAAAQIGGNVGYGSAGSGGSGGEAGSTNSVAGGGSGVVLLRKTMATVRANQPTVTANTNATLTVTASAPTAFPAVTSYDTTCTSSDGGATATGSSSTSSITVTGVDRGKTYTCTVRAYNGQYGTASLASTSVLVPGVPWNLGGADLPSVSGTPAYIPSTPEVLTGGTGTWQTPAGHAITGYTYAWQSSANCSTGWTTAAGSPTNAATYTVVAGDVGKCLRVGITATNSFGTSDPTYSAATALVTSPPAFTASSPPVIADVGYFAGYTFAASGYRITYTIDSTGLTGLPSPMSINGSTGALTGTPAAGSAGVYTYKVVATNDSGSVSTSTLTLTVSSGVATALTFTTQPAGGGRSGALLPTQPVLELKDSDGRLIAQPAAVVATVSAGGTLGGTTSVNTSSGVVTYTNLTLAGLVNTNYTLTFTRGSVTAASNPVQVTPGDVASIEILTQPVAAAAAGDLLATQPVVRLKDAQGNVVNDRSETVSVTSVQAGTSTAGGAVTGSQAAGLATTSGTVAFTNLAFGGTIGASYELKFTSGSAPSVTALSAAVSSTQAGPAAKLSIQTQPGLDGTQLVGSAFTTQPVVRILDTGDNLTTSTSTVTAASSGGTLGGTTGVPAVSGTSTFTNLTFAGLIGTNYTLTFTSPGLTSTTSNNFQFANASQRGPVSTGTSTISSSDAGLAADGADTATITVQMKDAGGNNLTTSQGVVALAATVGTLGVVTDNNNGTYTATYISPSSRGSGEAVISGTLAGNAITDTATVLLYATQTITFPQPANVLLGTLPYALDATASSGLSVTYASTTSSVCTATSGGIVTILTTGNCQINADQAGNAIYWPALQVSRTFVVSATTPTAPFITSIVEGNTQATVNFNAPGFNGGSAMTDYEYSLNGGTSWVSGASASSPITITGLTNGVTYQVSLRAVNGIGAGLASNASSPFTPVASGGTTVTIPTTTPSAPRNAQVVAEPATTAIVSWSEPRSNGGAAISSYTVTVSPSVTCSATLDATSGTGTCSASGLTPGVTYTFTIRAVNVNGAGDAATVSYTVPGGGGSGGSGGGGGGGGGGNGDTTSGDSGGGGGGGGGGDDDGDGTGGTRKPFPPEVPTPDGPTDEETGEILKKPSTVSVSDLPTLPIVQGTGPMPGGNPDLDSGLRSGMKGVKVMPTASAELAAALAAGAKVSMATGTAQVGYLTSRKIIVAPGTMLQIVSALEPDDQQMAFRLWMQDRSGAWFRMGRITTVNGQVVFLVMQFETPGTYQVIATSVSGPKAVDADGNPVFGSTTVRTIVIVTPRQALGTKVCPNMIAFDPRSAMLSKETKRQIRKLAGCLGAMPAIKVSGYVAQAVRPEAAERMAFLRARNVRNYLRELGYDGGAKVRTSIELRPAACEVTNNRCALVRLDLGTERRSERAAWQLVAAPDEGGTSPNVEAGSSVPVAPEALAGQADASPSGAPPGASTGAGPPVVT